MKKKVLVVVLAVVLSLGLTGCIIPTVPDLTEEQEKVITEYAAGLIKKYDLNSNTKILTDEELEAEHKAEEEQKAKEERNKKLAEEYLAKVQANEQKKQEEKAAKGKKGSDGNNGSDGTQTSEGKSVAGPTVLDKGAIESYFGTEGVNIAYKNFDIVDSYPEDGSSYFGVDAEAGKKLVVVNLGISNNSSDDVFLDMFSQHARYSLKIGEDTIPADSTVLLNDFSMYKDSIAAGDSVDTVLLFEVPEGSSIATGNGTGATVEISGSNGQGIFEIN